MENTPKQETRKMEGSEKWPIGMTYEQYPEKKSPAKLFGGTWEAFCYSSAGSGTSPENVTGRVLVTTWERIA